MRDGHAKVVDSARNEVSHRDELVLRFNIFVVHELVVKDPVEGRGLIRNGEGKRFVWVQGLLVNAIQEVEHGWMLRVGRLFWAKVLDRGKRGGGPALIHRGEGPSECPEEFVARRLLESDINSLGALGRRVLWGRTLRGTLAWGDGSR